MDAASWVNGFMAWALWPLAWALVRRCVFEARSPLLAFVACASMIGIGYVHGTLMLAATFVGTLLEAILAKHRPTTVRAFAAATLAGLFAIIVHLPGLLISPVTGRTAGVQNTGLMTVDLSGLAASAVPVSGPQMVFFGQMFPNAPLLYISWFLPLLAFVEWRRLIPLLRARSSVLVVLGAALFALLLPSDFGPLRFPVRLMPYVSVGVLVVLGIGVSLAGAIPPSRRRLFVAIGAALGVGVLRVRDRSRPRGSCWRSPRRSPSSPCGRPSSCSEARCGRRAPTTRVDRALRAPRPRSPCSRR